MTKPIQHQFYVKQFFRRFLAIAILFCVINNAQAQKQEAIVRLSKIEIFPQHLEAYKTILTQEASASIRLEKGVIAIFPMYQKDDSTQIRILEIYKNNKAYQAHLKTDHFLKYKTSTLKMVKSLKLLDMNALDLKAAAQIFKKMKQY